ncbi:MAG: Rpn family recombination-promoting nuclease/putative transposase [Bacteroidales bacterium]|nr:Rpn family recombination-promoting nuclease/putative transposase [Bacteroidales bacterium]
MGKFVNPFTDTGFKILFGQELSKPLLIDFLNSLLSGKEKIVDLKFLDKEKPRLYKNDRGLIYDIYCETDTGKKIIVEMQNRSQEFFIERSIFYVSQAVSRQGKKGEWDYNFDSVYLVAFMNFKLDCLKEFRTDASLKNDKTNEVISDKIKFIYLQLPYFTKEEDECKTYFDKWIYIFKNMEILERIPWAAKNSVFSRLGEIAEIANMTETQRRKYDKDLKILRDNYNILEFAKKEARKEGRAEGRAEGLKEKAIEMAIEMLKEGLPIETVAKISKLSISEVENLKKQFNTII